jgi:hypothetical protein
MVPALSSLNKSLENTSEPRMKRNGDRESHCLKPPAEEMIPKELPFSKMEKKVEEMQVLIHAIQVEQKLSFSMMTSRNPHSILSKAFSMSIFRNKKPPLPFLLLKECKSS